MSEARDRDLPLQVYVTNAERGTIRRGALAAGLTVSSYLRALGANHVPRNLPNRKAIDGLADVNADINKLITSVGKSGPVAIALKAIQAKLGLVVAAIE